MRINLSTTQIMAIIDIDKESLSYGEAILILKKAIKSEANTQNVKIDSLIFELTKNGYVTDQDFSAVLDKLKIETDKGGRRMKDKYFDEEGGIRNK